MFEKHPSKILIIEDNPSNHELFMDAFTAAGFSVVISPYIDEKFLDDVVGIVPDIISMDIMIAGPGVEVPDAGLAAIQALKADKRTRNIPVMVLTNFFEETKVDRAKAEGAVDFINLQGQTMSTIPKIFKRYLEDPKKYRPVHPAFRES